MKRHISFGVLIIILSAKTFSQIVFEEGYFINEYNQKINCLIKNIDWENNPSEFEYKISQDSSVQKVDIQKVKEFGITGVSKYIMANVQIDRSSDDINELSKERNPIFQEEKLFLKVLIEGKASLFIYEGGNLTRFFYKTNDSVINQLVYKRYFIDEHTFGKNNLYRQQLLNDLRCQGITSRDVEYVNYYKKDLEKFFLNYNKCASSDYVNYESKPQRDLFNLSIRPSFNLSNLSISNSSSWNIELGNKFNFRFGIEAELILPFNKNKWGVIMEPTYQYYNSKKTTEANNVSGGFLVSKVNYKSIELPIGVRHYFFINDKSKIFINVSYIRDFCFNSVFEITRNDGSNLNSLEIKSRNNLACGIGYKYKNRYGIELRYQTSREILGNYLTWNSQYKTVSIIFGYSLF